MKIEIINKKVFENLFFESEEVASEDVLACDNCDWLRSVCDEEQAPPGPYRRGTC